MSSTDRVKLSDPYAIVEMIDYYHKEVTKGHLLEVRKGHGSIGVSLKVDGDDGVRNLDLRFHGILTLEENVFIPGYRTITYFTPDPHDQIEGIGLCSDWIKIVRR